MKKVLFFTLEMQGLQEASQIQAANEHIKEGDEVLFVTCGPTLGSCNENRKFNHLQCLFCKKRQLARSRKYLPGLQQIRSIDDFITEDIRQQARQMTFHFQTMDELKAIQYDHIEIGYGALSSYISYTRNIEANVGEEKLYQYLVDLLRMQVRMILTFKKIIKDFTPDLMIFHNGRFAEYKPLLGLARNMHIEFVCTENLVSADGTRCQDNYPNGTPHNVYDRDRQIKRIWNMNDDTKDREKTARSFFENRRHAKFAGDTIYTKDQKAGTMPEGWDDQKENIVIFNSSEDEFFAIGNDSGVKSVFKSQLEGIKAIAEHYKNDTRKHFTLRVHPHLKGLPFAYHQNLYKLKYDNMTVIPAESAVSSYSLLDGASKIIVFGSTMGVESSYWRKPVINLAYAMYNLMDVVYIPKDEEELWKLIENPALQPKNPDNALPYGYYYMTTKKPKLEYAQGLLDRKMLSLGGNRYIYHEGYKFFGSEHLYGIWRALMYRYEGLVPGLSKYKKVPQS